MDFDFDITASSTSNDVLSGVNKAMRVPFNSEEHSANSFARSTTSLFRAPSKVLRVPSFAGVFSLESSDPSPDASAGGGAAESPRPAQLGRDKSSTWPDDVVLLKTDGSDGRNAYDVLGDFADVASVSDLLSVTTGTCGV